MARNPVTRSPRPPSSVEARARRAAEANARMNPEEDDRLLTRRSREERENGYAKGGMVGMKPVRCF